MPGDQNVTRVPAAPRECDMRQSAQSSIAAYTMSRNSVR
jgi:hypothetical protein